ncbi:MAG TPA: ThuA domain-containing protein [Chloroflexota bacterium]|nr:ThuA domain-containing protein [Chloroflexota bacterium]
MTEPIRVTVWGENVHEHEMPRVRELYPEGMHEAIAQGLRADLGERVQVRTATLQETEHGLTPEVLAATDVLTWWGHAAHEQVSDVVVDRVYQAVLAGMGLLVLHSGHLSKIFRRLMGTSCSLRWREADDREVVWTVNPGHPIAGGVPEVFIIPRQEMYGEYFDIPQPDELIFISSFTGGEVFRSGCCFYRAAGRVFYFSPGHETYPVYAQPEIRRVLANAVLWANRAGPRRAPTDMSFTPMGWFEGERS